MSFILIESSIRLFRTGQQAQLWALVGHDKHQTQHVWEPAMNVAVIPPGSMILGHLVLLINQYLKQVFFPKCKKCAVTVLFSVKRPEQSAFSYS